MSASGPRFRFLRSAGVVNLAPFQPIMILSSRPCKVSLFSWLLETLPVNRGSSVESRLLQRHEFGEEKNKNTGCVFRRLEMGEERVPPVGCPWYYNAGAMCKRQV